MTPDKKPGAAFWASVMVVAALAAYPLSLGPACWVSSRLGWGAEAVSAMYEPLVFDSPAFTHPAMHVYSQLGAAKGWYWRRLSGGWTNLPTPGAK